jgi:hypothetical protein
LTPEIRLIVDDSIERSERMYKLLDRARAIEAGEIEPPPIALPGDDDDNNDEEYEDDDSNFMESDEQNIVDLGFFDDEDEEEGMDGEVDEVMEMFSKGKR